MAFGLLLAYSLLIRRHKALATLVSTYMAMMVAVLWGDAVAEFFSGDRVLFNQVWIQASASAFTVKTALLVGLTGLLSAFMKLGGRRSRYSTGEVLVYVTATMALATVFMLDFMPPDMRASVVAGSDILPLVQKFREWIIVVPTFLVVFFGIQGDDE